MHFPSSKFLSSPRRSLVVIRTRSATPDARQSVCHLGVVETLRIDGMIGALDQPVAGRGEPGHAANGPVLGCWRLLDVHRVRRAIPEHEVGAGPALQGSI